MPYPGTLDQVREPLARSRIFDSGNATGEAVPITQPLGNVDLRRSAEDSAYPAAIGHVSAQAHNLIRKVPAVALPQQVDHDQAISMTRRARYGRLLPVRAHIKREHPTRRVPDLTS
jgi:hypothetical protein